MNIERLVVVVVVFVVVVGSLKNIVTKNGHRNLASFIDLDEFKVRGRTEFISELE